jgi:hypothetical protein
LVVAEEGNVWGRTSFCTADVLNLGPIVCDPNIVAIHVLPFRGEGHVFAKESFETGLVLGQMAKENYRLRSLTDGYRCEMGAWLVENSKLRALLVGAKDSGALAAQLAMKLTCPWCHGRHVVDEELVEALNPGQGYCSKCQGTDELTLGQIADFLVEEKVRVAAYKAKAKS